MTRETLIAAERLAKINKRIEIIEDFLDEMLNFRYHKAKENPRPVKDEGCVCYGKDTCTCNGSIHKRSFGCY